MSQLENVGRVNTKNILDRNENVRGGVTHGREMREETPVYHKSIYRNSPGIAHKGLANLIWFLSDTQFPSYATKASYLSLCPTIIRSARQRPKFSC